MILNCFRTNQIRLFRLAIAAALQLLSAIALAEDSDAQPYSLDITEANPQNGDHPLAPADASFQGNPIADTTSWWPEDLVLAPIPGHSPEIGWNLAIAGGYFLDLGGREAPASLVGLYGMASENGSKAYVAGSRLHLLGDRLRVVAALAHLDFKYRFGALAMMPAIGDETLIFDRKVR